MARPPIQSIHDDEPSARLSPQLDSTAKTHREIHTLAIQAVNHHRAVGRRASQQVHDEVTEFKDLERACASSLSTTSHKDAGSTSSHKDVESTTSHKDAGSTSSHKDADTTSFEFEFSQSVDFAAAFQDEPSFLVHRDVPTLPPLLVHRDETSPCLPPLPESSPSPHEADTTHLSALTDTPVIQSYFPAQKTTPRQSNLPPPTPTPAKPDYAAQRAQLERDRISLDKEKLALRAERATFNQWRDAQHVELAEQHRQLKRDKFSVNQLRKEAPNPATKRSELESLQTQLKSARESVKSTMAKAKLTEDRLKRRIDVLQAKLDDAHQEIRVLEAELAHAQLQTKPRVKSASFSHLASGTSSTSGYSSNLVQPSIKRSSTQSSLSTSSSNGISPRRYRPTSAGNSSSVGNALSMPRSTSPLTFNTTSSISMHKPRSISVSNTPAQSGKSIEQLNMKSMASMSDTLDRFAAIELESNLGPHLLEKVHRDGITERRYTNGTRVVQYKNGTTKECQLSGMEIFRYINDDIKQVFPDGKLVYYFADKQVTQTNFADGMVLTEFANGQTEKKYVDGMIEIMFPNESVRYVYPSGEKQDIFPNGTIEKTDTNGNKQVIHSDGSKEFWTKGKKKRVMPNGEVKIVFADGTRQKIMPDGRIRVIDPDGIVTRDDIGEDG